MRSTQWLGLSLIALCLILGCGCAGNGPRAVPPPLSSSNVNLIFVVSEDLDYNATGDINPTTANLTNQGLQRTLLMAPFLQERVLGNKNVTGIYALEPMTHLQTAQNYPDMVGLETIQQFALLNQVSVPAAQVGTAQYTAHSFPLNVSYVSGQTVNGVSPLIYCEGCQGLDFGNQPGYDGVGDNDSLVSGGAGVIGFNVPGFYVFSAPWETTSALLESINSAEKYALTLPESYQGPNYIYAISITSAGNARLVTYNSDVTPPTTYPALPSVKVSNSCTGGQIPMNITITAGVNGNLPAGINTNETIYMMRHAEAHPIQWWEDGNYVAAGQWRALDLPAALQGKFNPAPTQIYSIDPAQETPSGNLNWSYVRPSLTVEPYAIASQLPYHLASTFSMFNIPAVIAQENQFFFNNPPYSGTPLLPQQPPSFSGETVLLAWEHSHFQPTVNALLKSYHSTETAVYWPENDYDTIWTVKIDGVGNLSVDNELCEGIDSTKLPATAPQF